VFSAPTLIGLSGVYATNSDYSHGFLIPLVGLILAKQRWKRAISTAGTSSQAGGLCLLFLGCALVLFGQWYETALRPGYLGHLFLRGTGLLTALCGLTWAMLGWRSTIVLAPALGFLCFAIPLPESFLLPFTSMLQRFVSVASEQILRVLGTEVYRDGNVLHLHNQALGVADACSGIRSLAVLLSISVGTGLYLQLRHWRAVLLVAAAPAAAVAGNTLRVTVSALLAAHGYEGFAEGPRHDLLGLITVLLSGAALVLVARLLVAAGRGVALPPHRQNADLMHMPANDSANREQAHRTGAPTRNRWNWQAFSSGVSIVVLLSAITTAWVIHRHYREQLDDPLLLKTNRKTLDQFPRRLGSYTYIRERQLSPPEREMLNPSDHTIRWYSGPSKELIACSIIYWSPQIDSPLSRFRSRPNIPHVPGGCYPVAGWEHERAFDDTITREWLSGYSAHIQLFHKPLESRVILNWFETEESDRSPFTPSGMRERLALLAASWKEPLTSSVARRFSVSVSVTVRTNPAAAKRTAIHFAKTISPILADYGI